MKAKLNGHYFKNGSIKYRFTVHGTDSEILEYLESKGDFARYLDGNADNAPLLFNKENFQLRVGQSINMVKGYNSEEWYVDNTAQLMSEEAQIKHMMLELEAKRRFNEKVYGGQVDYSTGEITQPEAEPATEVPVEEEAEG